MTDLEGAVELDEAHRALTAASRQLPELWEQPHKAAEGVVVNPQHLRAILAALKAARHDYHTKAREAEDALASITRERDEARALLGVESINGVLGYCLEQDRCGCGGDVPAIRATCDNWCKLKEQSAALVNGEGG